MDKTNPLNIGSQLSDPAFKQQVAQVFSMNPTANNQPATSTQKITSPFPHLQSTSLFNLKPPTQPSQEQKDSSPPKSSSGQAEKIFQGLMFKYMGMKNSNGDDSKSDVTQKKTTPVIGVVDREKEGKGFMAKKSSKSPTNEANQNTDSNKKAANQSNSSEFNILGSSTSEKLKYFSNSLKQTDNKQDKPENKQNKQSNNLVIPCLNKGAEETAKANQITAPSQQKSTAPINSFFTGQRNPSGTNPLGTTSNPIKQTDATSNNTNTPTFGTINQTNTSHLQQGTSPFNQKPATFNQTPGAQSQPQIAIPQSSNHFMNQGHVIQLEKNQFSNQNNQNIPVSHSSQGIFQPNSVPIMSAQQFYHKQHLLQVSKNQKEQIFERIQSDFDIQNLTAEKFIRQCHDILKEVFSNVDYLAKQPQLFIVEFQQNQAIRSTLQDLQYSYSCSPDKMLQSIYDIQSKQKELEMVLQSIQQKLNNCFEQHSMSVELSQMMEIEEEIIDQELQQSFTATNDLSTIFGHLAAIEGELDQLNRQLNMYLLKFPCLDRQ